MLLENAISYIDNMGKLFSEFGSGQLRILFIAFLSFTILLWIVNYVFMGIGLYKLAKNNDVQRAYLAWIPFANLYLMGKLAGKTSIFGWKIANIGLIVMILNLVTDVLSAYVDFCTYFPFSYKLVVKGVLGTVPSAYPSVWCEAFAIIAEIADIVSIFFTLALLFDFFRKFNPANSMIFALISFFLSPIMGVFVFACRNKKAVDFNEYMRKRQYDYYTRNNQNPFGGQNQGNPYNSGEEKTNNYRPPENPFKEFPDGENEQNNSKKDPFDGKFN